MEFPEAILFDLDGVLLDTEPLLANAWSETAKEYNHSLSIDKLLELKGRRRIDCCLLYTSPSPRDGLLSRMPSSA